MTSATVDTNQGSGQYGITLVYDTVVLDGQIAALEQQLIDGVQPLLDAQIALSDARAERETLADALDAAIIAYQAGDTDADPVIDATRALAEQAAAVTIAELTVQRLTGQKLSLSARLTFLQNLIVAQQAATTFVWCADYSTDIDPGTTVPVAITPGEIGPGGEPFVILPRQHPDGYGATYSRAEFGQLVPRMSMAPVVTFANWGLLPGWQRWMPTFRIGEIESLDTGANTCNLLLESARSSAGPYPYSYGLNVNLAESTDTRLEGVPVRYMTCDAAAFQVGDRVLVRFKNVDPATPDSNWGNPEVVGFVTGPRECPGGGGGGPFFPYLLEPQTWDYAWTGSSASTVTTEESEGGQFRVVTSDYSETQTFSDTLQVDLWGTEAAPFSVMFSVSGTFTETSSQARPELEDFETIEFDSTFTVTITATYPIIGEITVLQETLTRHAELEVGQSITYSRTERLIDWICDSGTPHYYQRLFEYPEGTVAGPCDTIVEELSASFAGTVTSQIIKDEMLIDSSVDSAPAKGWNQSISDEMWTTWSTGAFSQDEDVALEFDGTPEASSGTHPATVMAVDVFPATKDIIQCDNQAI